MANEVPAAPMSVAKVPGEVRGAVQFDVGTDSGTNRWLRDLGRADSGGKTILRPHPPATGEQESSLAPLIPVTRQPGNEVSQPPAASSNDTPGDDDALRTADILSGNRPAEAGELIAATGATSGGDNPPPQRPTDSRPDSNPDDAGDRQTELNRDVEAMRPPRSVQELQNTLQSSIQVASDGSHQPIGLEAAYPEGTDNDPESRRIASFTVSAEMADALVTEDASPEDIPVLNSLDAVSLDDLHKALALRMSRDPNISPLLRGRWEEWFNEDRLQPTEAAPVLSREQQRAREMLEALTPSGPTRFEQHTPEQVMEALKEVSFIKSRIESGKLGSDLEDILGYLAGLINSGRIVVDDGGALMYSLGPEARNNLLKRLESVNKDLSEQLYGDFEGQARAIVKAGRPVKAELDTALSPSEPQVAEVQPQPSAAAPNAPASATPPDQAQAPTPSTAEPQPAIAVPADIPIGPAIPTQTEGSRPLGDIEEPLVTFDAAIRKAAGEDSDAIVSLEAAFPGEDHQSSANRIANALFREGASEVQMRAVTDLLDDEGNDAVVEALYSMAQTFPNQNDSRVQEIKSREGYKEWEDEQYTDPDQDQKPQKRKGLSMPWAGLIPKVRNPFKKSKPSDFDQEEADSTPDAKDGTTPAASAAETQRPEPGDKMPEPQTPDEIEEAEYVASHEQLVQMRARFESGLEGLRDIQGEGAARTEAVLRGLLELTQNSQRNGEQYYDVAIRDFADITLDFHYTPKQADWILRQLDLSPDQAIDFKNRLYEGVEARANRDISMNVDNQARVWEDDDDFMKWRSETNLSVKGEDISAARERLALVRVNERASLINREDDKGSGQAAESIGQIVREVIRLGGSAYPRLQDVLARIDDPSVREEITQRLTRLENSASAVTGTATSEPQNDRDAVARPVPVESDQTPAEPQVRSSDYSSDLQERRDEMVNYIASEIDIINTDDFSRGAAKGLVSRAVDLAKIGTIDKAYLQEKMKGVLEDSPDASPRLIFNSVILEGIRQADAAFSAPEAKASAIESWIKAAELLGLDKNIDGLGDTIKELREALDL